MVVKVYTVESSRNFPWYLLDYLKNALEDIFEDAIKKESAKIITTDDFSKFKYPIDFGTMQELINYRFISEVREMEKKGMEIIVISIVEEGDGRAIAVGYYPDEIDFDPSIIEGGMIFGIIDCEEHTYKTVDDYEKAISEDEEYLPYFSM